MIVCDKCRKEIEGYNPLEKRIKRFHIGLYKSEEEGRFAYMICKSCQIEISKFIEEDSDYTDGS